jgi:nicotinamide-nucleotide amidase
VSLRCEVVAVGTELLLGQVVDTNSSWIGEQLALAGIDSHFQTKVGDNRGRIVAVLRLALDRSDAVIVCGGLGPTHDDITRECIAEVMGVELERHDDIAERITQMFASRGRRMAENNLRQADVPAGATVIAQVRGTAPGLVCPVGDKVIYAVPGVPHEMKEMVTRAILPDLRERSGETAVIVSRTLRTWGESESGLAEILAPLIDRLDETGNPTLAFLASGIEGLKVRLTAKAESHDAAAKVLAAEEQTVRAILGSLVFGIDDETMESAVLEILRRQGRSLALAESVTGGLVAARLTSVPGASDVFKGSVVSYATEVKQDILGVPEGPVVSEAAAIAMAEGACRVMDADVGLALTGVAGPSEQDGQPVGTLFVGLCIEGACEAAHLRLPGDRDQMRQFAVISSLNMMRLRLLERAADREAHA